MGKRGIQKERKIAVLEVIKCKKAVLFGNFKNVTSIQKQEAWEEVLLKAKSLELATNEKTWTYARDNLFGLWKSRSLSKRDNMRKTGTGGGKDKTLDEVDTIILDILGKDSKVVDGLRLPESGDNVVIIHGNEKDEDIANDEWKKFPPSTSNVSTDINIPLTNKNSARTIKRNNKIETTLAPNKKHKAKEAEKLKVELMKVEIYHRKLQILKIEEELGLPYSDFTRDIPKA